MRRSRHVMLGAARNETPCETACRSLHHDSRTSQDVMSRIAHAIRESGSTLGKKQDRRRTTRKTLSMVGPWQKNADLSNDARLGLETDAHHAAGDKDQSSA